MSLHPPRPAVAPEGASWQQVWRNAYPCDQPSTIPYPRIGLSALLTTAARRFPDRPACTLFGQAITYAELDEQARRLATALIAKGARPGRHVGLLLPNIPEYLVALQAVWLTGATALQLSPLMVAQEVNHWLWATDCQTVVTLDLLAPAVARSLIDGPLEHLVLTTLAPRMAVWRAVLYRLERLRRGGYMVLPEDNHHHLFGALLRSEPLAEPVKVDPAEDVAVLAPTGGTTASPKAVMLTHRNLVSNAFQLRQRMGGVDGEEGMLAVLPFFHAYGLTVSVLASWVKAATMHLLPRFEPRPVLELLREKRPELVPAVPAMLNALNKAARRQPLDLSFIRFVISGASALPPAVRMEFAACGVQDVVEGYGLTEASPVTHVNLPGVGNRPGTIGLPLPDTEARIVDPDSGRDLPDGEVGELIVRGPQVMKGYYHNPEATALALRDGWLYTGDVARRDRNGYYTLVDRKKDIIKTSGFLVYPAEVEEVMKLFPGVADAAVVGVPDAERGELVQALVVPRGRLDVNALESHCRERLSKHKRPRRIDVVRELPKNFLGKVLRRRLREAVIHGSGNGRADGDANGCAAAT
jgi:long-chain acyl-CoA synthetase